MNRIHKFLVVLVFLLCGVPISAQSATSVKCGDIIEDEFVNNAERNDYDISLNAGDTMEISGVPLGETLQFAIRVMGPTGQLLVVSNNGRVSPDPSIVTPILSANGIHHIWIANTLFSNNSSGSLHSSSSYWGGVGVYTLYIGCTLRDGTVINPGDVIETSSAISSSRPPEPATCTGPCFPGLPLVDFSEGIEIPITAGQAQTAPIGGDIVALYTYDATANQTATLSLSRVSGDISVGVSVIKRDTNEIVFVGGMPSSNHLSVELTFPSDGTYVIGLFRMDTAEKIDTSGAVQVMIE